MTAEWYRHLYDGEYLPQPYATIDLAARALGGRPLLVVFKVAVAASNAEGRLLVVAVTAVLTAVVTAYGVHVVVLAFADGAQWAIGQAVLTLPAAGLGTNLLLCHEDGAQLKLDKCWWAC